MESREEPCANCGAAINRRTEGYGYDPEKGLMCVDCWRIALGGKKKSPPENSGIQDPGYTSGPWTVDHTDQYGIYQIHEAAIENRDWVDEGYEISDKEGEHRNTIAEQHDEGNRRLIEAAPDLLEALEALIADAGQGKMEVIAQAHAVIAKAKGEVL